MVMGNQLEDFDFESRADFVIQVTMSMLPGTTLPMSTLMTWKKHSKTFGVADESLRWCPVDGCLTPFKNGLDLEKPSLALSEEALTDSLQSMMAINRERWHVCPSCGAREQYKNLPDSCTFQMQPKDLGSAVARVWDKFEGNADLYLVRMKAPRDFRKAYHELGAGADMKEFAKKMLAARQREQAFYSIASIENDLRTGHSVGKLFGNFLSA